MILVAKLIIGTLCESAQTAAANLPLGTKDVYILLNVTSRFGKNINPQRHSTASKEDFGNSRFSASLSLNSIISCNPRYVALSFAIESIFSEISVAKT